MARLERNSVPALDGALRFVRPLLACFIVMAVFACGGGGCSGCAQCGLEPIPGGFPPDRPRIANAGQIRLTQGGIQFIEDNIGDIAMIATGGPLTFPVPTTTVDVPVLRDATICPDHNCQIAAEIESLDLQPTAPNTLHAVVHIILDSRDLTGTRAPLPVDVDTGLIGTAHLGMDLDTRRGDRVFVALETDVTFANEARSPRTGFTRIDVGSITLIDGQGIEDADIEVTGSGVLGSVVSFLINLLKGTIVGMLADQISGLTDGLVGDNLCTTQGTTGCPTGTVADGSGPDAVCRFTAGGDCVPMLIGMDGQGDMGNAFLGSLSPGTHAPIQMVLASGEDGVAVNEGMSLYMTGGFLSYDRTFTRTPGHNPCVPMLEQPPVPPIARVPSFQGNVIPGTSTSTHLGIGVAEDYLNYAGYGMFDSGMLCLGVGTRLSQQLSTGLFSALVPTLRALTFPEGASPISLAVRPQQPPTFAIGTNPGDTLLTVTLPQAQIDFYVWSQERYVRFMTYQTDLEVGINLSVADGQIVPEIVGVTPRNSSVINSEILTENPESLAMTIETVITMFAGMLTSGIAPIDLPSVMGFDIQVPDDGIRGVRDGEDDFLGIFANLALAAPAPLTAPVDTSLELSDLEVIPESMGQDTFGQNGRNTVWLHFGAEGPLGVDYEYSYRIDGAIWSPWTRERRIQIDDAALLLQAHHTIEARARIAGQANTVDRSPATTSLLIDVLAPELTLEERDDAVGVHVIAEDIVTADERLEMRWRLADGHGGGEWSTWGPVTDLDADPELVEVEVRDEAGNVGRSEAPLIRGIPNPSAAGGCGCRVQGQSSHAPLGLFASLFVLGAVLVRRTRRASRGARRARRPFDVTRVLLGLVALAAMSITGCDCGGPMGGDDAGMSDAPVACGGATCRPARPPGDTSGEICCEAEMMCVDYDLDTICDPGFTCSVDNVVVDGSCEVSCSMCERLPPLPTGILATDLDLAVNGADSYLSGYSPGVPSVSGAGTPYGDLVFGTITGGDVSAIEWEIIDGVPSDAGRPVGDVDGWRGGIQAAGDDVGRWTSMVRADDGTFYISYYDVTNTALKIAIGHPGSWATHTVDATGDAGQYTSIALTASGAPAISYMRIEPAADGSGRTHSAVRVATASSATPAATSDWTSTEVSGIDGACRPEYCEAGQACLATGSCVTPATGCPADCGDQVCFAGSCQDALADPYIEDLYTGRGLYTQLATTASGLALTFYDRSEGNLYGAAFDGTAWGAPFLIDGYARTGAGDSGIGSSLFVDDAGTWHVSYVDGTDEGVRYAQVSGGSVTVRELVDDGTTDGTTPFTDGRHLMGDDSSVIVTAGGEVRVAYQDATAHTLVLARRSGTTWSTRVLDSEDHTGFWVEQATTDTGSRVATWWRRQMARVTIDGVRVISGD
ncbi:MAG: hypothetical protein K1X94_24960 [Sandaracinaceae bacterium]|nr:hypothetical protein [Sandaracinaceae bacterium]